MKSENPPSPNYTPSYWWLEDAVAHSFNRLKAQTFNLIEAAGMSEAQQEAMKGLIKGFANDEYRRCLVDMRYEARKAKFIGEEDESATPPHRLYRRTP